ncbi:hypothetical protein ACFQY7_20585 [Actinomadura luteofluorescens]|uniref:hypothetical protein n=1 Tax=Actinomadura luteofluorescens TaxID=46163 RepID=UPI003638408B
MLSMINKFKNSAEERESKDEALIGEMVFTMAHLGCPVIGIKSGADLQYVRFKPVNDPVLYSFTIVLDRKTGTACSSRPSSAARRR